MGHSLIMYNEEVEIQETRNVIVTHSQNRYMDRMHIVIGVTITTCTGGLDELAKRCRTIATRERDELLLKTSD